MTPLESWLLVLLVVVPAAGTVAGLVWWGWSSWREHHRVLTDAREKFTDETVHLDDDDAPPGHVSMERLCQQAFIVRVDGHLIRHSSLYGLLLECEENPGAAVFEIRDGKLMFHAEWRAER